MAGDAPPLLDTDTLSEVMRGRDPGVARRATAYLLAHGRLRFSVLTRHEIARGLESIGARTQLRRFLEQCRSSEILPLDDRTADRAARIYADLRSGGRPIGDADILIAATALVHGGALVTENTRHFERIGELEISSWRSS